MLITCFMSIMSISLSHCLLLVMLSIKIFVIFVACDMLVSFILFLCGMTCFFNLVFILPVSVFAFIFYCLSL